MKHQVLSSCVTSNVTTHKARKKIQQDSVLLLTCVAFCSFLYSSFAFGVTCNDFVPCSHALPSVLSCTLLLLLVSHVMTLFLAHMRCLLFLLVLFWYTKAKATQCHIDVYIINRINKAFVKEEI